MHVIAVLALQEAMVGSLSVEKLTASSNFPIVTNLGRRSTELLPFLCFSSLLQPRYPGLLYKRTSLLTIPQLKRLLGEEHRPPWINREVISC
jgi:hypothetical protein